MKAECVLYMCEDSCGKGKRTPLNLADMNPLLSRFTERVYESPQLSLFNRVRARIDKARASPTPAVGDARGPAAEAVTHWKSVREANSL